MILVTGGAGFIGSNLVAALAERGTRVVVSDWLGHDERWRNLAKHAVHDLVAPEALLGWLERHGPKLEALVHLGAVTRTDETDVDLIVTRNVRASLDLLEWCTGAQVPFLYASSAATYGDGAQGFEDDPAPQALAALRPRNAYGWSKHLVDRRIAGMAARDERRPPQWVGLKFFNVYGPNEYHKGSMQSVVARSFAGLHSGGPLRLFRSARPDYRDGEQMRDFVYVRDCVDLMLWLLAHREVSGLFNVGTGRARTWKALGAAMFKALDRPEAIEWIDLPASLAAQYQYFTEARMERLRQAGYRAPFASLEEGVGDYVKNYLLTADPYR